MTGFLIIPLVAGVGAVAGRVAVESITARSRVKMISIAARTGRKIEIERGKITFWPQQRK